MLFGNNLRSNLRTPSSNNKRYNLKIQFSFIKGGSFSQENQKKKNLMQKGREKKNPPTSTQLGSPKCINVDLSLQMQYTLWDIFYLSSLTRIILQGNRSQLFIMAYQKIAFWLHQKTMQIFPKGRGSFCNRGSIKSGNQPASKKKRVPTSGTPRSVDLP